jgi:hypothetical protein
MRKKKIITVHGEELVVGVRLHEVPVRRQQLDSQYRREDTADGEHDRDDDEVEDGDALVVDRQQPRANPVVRIEIVDLFVRRNRVFGQSVRALHGFLPAEPVASAVKACLGPSERM